MLGCSRRPTAFISRWKRATAPLSRIRFGRQDFQSDGFIELRMQGFINRSHAPFAELGEQLVLANHRQSELVDGHAIAGWVERHFCAARRFVR